MNLILQYIILFIIVTLVPVIFFILLLLLRVIYSGYKLSMSLRDEYDYFGSRIERYTTIAYGSSEEFDYALYKPNVNFSYYIMTDCFIFLFDRKKTLFSIYNKETNKTMLYTMKQALLVFDEYEEKIKK